MKLFTIFQLPTLYLFLQYALLMFFLVIQHLNYRLLGFRLYEGKCPVNIVNAVLDKVMQVHIYFWSISSCITFFTIGCILSRFLSHYLSTPLGLWCIFFVVSSSGGKGWCQGHIFYLFFVRM